MAIARCQNCGKPEGRRQTYVTYGSTSKKRRPSIQGSESFVFLLSQRRSALKRLPKSN